MAFFTPINSKFVKKISAPLRSRDKEKVNDTGKEMGKKSKLKNEDGANGANGSNGSNGMKYNRKTSMISSITSSMALSSIDLEFKLKADEPVDNYGIMSKSVNFEPPLKEITGVEFTFLTPSEIKDMAVYELSTTKFTGSGSVYDSRCGSTENYEKCPVCSMGWKDCQGHPFYIDFPQPIPHPVLLKLISEWLTCVCEFCHRIVINPKQIKTLGLMKYKGRIRFNEFVEQCKKQVRCNNCSKPHGKYTLTEDKDKFIKNYKTSGRKNGTEKVPIPYSDVVKILSNIREKEVKLLGFPNPKSHPKNMIMSAMYGIPSNCRPFVISNNSICHDDLSNKLIDIYKTAIKFKENSSEKSLSDNMDSFIFHVKTYMDNSKGKARDPGGNRPLKTIKQRMSSKTGQIRQNVQGKRTTQCARTVISPDPDLAVDEIGVPEEIADKLTYPERVWAGNLAHCQKLLEEGKVIRICRGEKNIDARYALWTPGFILEYGDKVLRNGKRITPGDGFKFEKGDAVIRMEKVEKEDGSIEIKKKLIRDVSGPTRKHYSLKIGDVIERKLQNGDYCLFNRQPTLHEASLQAKKVRIHKWKTFRFNLSSTSAFGADFDGDEMNLFPAQTFETRAEMMEIMSTQAQFISGSDSKPMLVIKQDARIGGFLLTEKWTSISRETFMDVCMTVDWDMVYISRKIDHIKEVYNYCGLVDEKISEIERGEGLERVEEMKTKLGGEGEFRNKITESLLYTGHGLLSMLFPDNLYFCIQNDMSKDKKPFKIERGVIISGTMGKGAIDNSSGGLIHHLCKDYSADLACQFLTNYQRFINLVLSRRGFSVGLSDCMPKNVALMENELNKYFLQAKKVMEEEDDLDVRESKILNLLNEATNIGDRIAKNSLSPENNVVKMVFSGSKGSMFNIVNMTSAIGQQNLEGKRAAKNYGGRSLPCYQKTSKSGLHYAPDSIPENKTLSETDNLSRLFQSRGFIKSSFYGGLSPQEFFFLAAGGREGLIDTSVKTAKCGYLSRRLLKIMEDLKISYTGAVVNSRNNVIQFCYGEDNYSVPGVIKTKGHGFQCSDISHIVDSLNSDWEWENR